MTTAAESRSLTRLNLRSYAGVMHYVALGLLLLAGGFLRLTGLRRQSLWFDEADVVVRAQQPFDEILRTFVAPGENGPIYNLMLAIWIRIAGISEIAVRAPSAVFGVLALPLIYLLVRRIAGSPVALVATGLLAFNPYHIWYSQEAKMYTMVVVLALTSVYALVAALSTNRGWWWVAYAAVTTLMFYTHVATILVFGAQFLYALATWRDWPGRGRNLTIAFAVLTLPYVPIGIWALRVVGGGADTWHPAVSLWNALEIFGLKFAIDRWEDDSRVWAAILYAVLAVGGIAALAYWRRRERWWMLVSFLVAVPVVGLWVVSLQQSVFSDRYGIVALPFYLTLVAAAVVWMVKHRYLWPVGVLAIFLLVSFAWGPIRDVNRSEAAEKEDWRSAYAWIAERGQPDDVIVIQPGYLISTYQYHVQREPRLRETPAVAMGSFAIDWFDESDMMTILVEEAEGSERIWLVQSPDRVPSDDPDGRLEARLDEEGQVTNQHEVIGVEITLYDLDEPISRE